MKQCKLLLSCTMLFSIFFTCQPISSIAQETTKSLRYRKMSGTIAGVQANRFEPRGVLIMRYENGKVALRGQFAKGVPSGKWQRLYPNGQPFGEYSYDSGVLDGAVVQYWDDGSLARFGHYSRGKPSGQLLFFSREGKLTKRMFFAGKPKKPSIATRYRFICTVRKGKSRCKTIDDIRHDLGTIISEEQVEELLGNIDSVYDNLGFDDTADALISCADGRLTAKRTGGTIADLVAGTPYRKPNQDSLKQSGRTTSIFGDFGQVPIETVNNLAASSCRNTGGRGAIGGNTGFTDRTDPGQRNAINRAVQTMESSIQNCHESSMERFVGNVDPNHFYGPSGAGGITPQTLVAIAVGVAVFAAEKIGESIMDSILNDGYADKGTQMPNGAVKYAHATNPSDYKIVDEANNSTTYHSEIADGSIDMVVYDEPKLDGSGWFIHSTWTRKDKNGNVVEKGTVRSLPKSEAGSTEKRPSQTQTVVEKKNADGSTTTTVTEDGKKKRETTKDAQGNVINDTKYGPDGKPIKDSSTPQGDRPSSGSGVGMPVDPNTRSRCQQAQQAWQQFKARCDQADWQTYDCQKFVAIINGCPDPAEILPSPDGDAVCRATSDADRELAIRASCERKKGIMIPSGDRDVCDKPDDKLELPLNGMDICDDPRAMCRPDAMTGLDELSRDAPNP